MEQQSERSFLSCEKLFTIEATGKNQNNIEYGKSSADIDESVITIYRQKKTFSLMVWAAICESRKSPLFFVEQGVTINTHLYNNGILVPAFKEMKKHFKYQHFTPITF